MKRIFTFFLSMMLIALTQGQTNADFENFNIPVDSFYNGSAMGTLTDGGFYSGNIFLKNSYNPTFNSWSDWAISTMRDTVTPGFMNDLSSITGGGYNGSLTYAVAFGSDSVIIDLTNNAEGNGVKGFYITNNTYAYLSMRDGDGFAKKFGGELGDDPDYLLLTIKKYKDGTLSTDSVDFYLADYRFADNSEDYIVKEWTYLSLESLGDIDSLECTLRSTDNDPMFGMNTPAYFCMDNFVTNNVATSTENTLTAEKLQVYPNPTNGMVNLAWNESGRGTLILADMMGKSVLRKELITGQNQFDISVLPAGVYTMNVTGGKGNYFGRIVKN